MEILLLRHGIAADARPGQPDADRALTGEGKQKLRALLRRLRKAGVRPALILSSPYLRARQTAEIAREILAPDAIIVPARALTPGASPQEAWDEIRLYSNQPSVLCASHEPLCSQLAAFLLGAPELHVDFKKGALMRIDVESLPPRPRGTLRWLVSPRLA
ncbi:MAG: phosphohistidine phosphatase SixA [Bryobacteraceae bacterium]|nr:MAG: phosphohistidine phosphatase SixA [Bryobacteraceae bacterium]